MLLFVVVLVALVVVGVEVAFAVAAAAAEEEEVLLGAVVGVLHGGPGPKSNEMSQIGSIVVDTLLVKKNMKNHEEINEKI